jgi:hypothetical protein
LHKICLRSNMANGNKLHRYGDYLSDSGWAVYICEVDWQKCKGLAVRALI